MNEPTHRDLCRATAAYMLSLDWCTLALWEVSFGTGVADVVAMSSPDMEAGHVAAMARWNEQREAWEADAEGRAERASRLASQGFRPLPVPVTFPTARPRCPFARLAVVEVKRTRSDLLRDFGSGKALKYRERASHVYLAATPEAFGVRADVELVGNRELHADLEARGVPREYGLILLRCVEGGIAKSLIRPAKALHPEPPSREVRVRWCERLARSLLYRVIEGTMPEMRDV